MTQHHGGSVSPQSDRPTPDVARDEAAGIAKTAGNRGSDVADTVGEQASRVASETSRQARNLVREGRDQLADQTRQGQQRAVGGLRKAADQLHQMSEKSDGQGVVPELARQAADRTRGIADWLDKREPGDLVDEVRRFARRKPGVFLLGATLAGVAVGRLTRGAVAARSGDDDGHGDRHDGGRHQSDPTIGGTSGAGAPAGPPMTPATATPYPEQYGQSGQSPTPGYAPTPPVAPPPPVTPTQPGQVYR
jgi:hypothetical protein